MNEIKIFENQEFGKVRALEIDGKPYFVGKDVAEALGYANPQKAIRDHTDIEDRTVNDSFTVNGTKVILINESGLYSLILSSKLESAKRFKHWVTSEVLPSISRTGSYQMTMPQGKELLALAVLEAQKTIEAQNKDIERMKPKEIFADAVSASHTTILIGELAKLLRQNGIDIGAKRLFAWMRENGYLVKRQGTDYNTPTQKSVDLGVLTTKETTVLHPDGSTKIVKTAKVTGKGQQYFINKFLKAAS
jgi:anti-repressor protein|uniref:Repressor domain protein n=1 Tax=Myoviridae sp. ct0wg9 TaxID=2826600 RepID=A0A8S5NFM3_9CAUD|nr:MAG TPA: repressor domain protein [Myoviridae sp. ct0wg9]